MNKTLKNFGIIKWFLDIRRELSLIRFQITRQTKLQQEIYKEIFKFNTTRNEKVFPIDFEHQTFSQNGEDGILQEIFRRLQIDIGSFIEIGIGDGSENNTRLLLETGWKGTWIDGCQNAYRKAMQNFDSFLREKSLVISNSLVTENNINELLCELNIPKDVDLLSIDIDLTTHLVWEKIESIKPKVCVIEYNGFFPDKTIWEADIKKNLYWDGSINMGASLQKIIKISKNKGYNFIGCDITGTNAFFALENISVDIKKKNDIYTFQKARPYLFNTPEHVK